VQTINAQNNLNIIKKAEAVIYEAIPEMKNARLLLHNTKLNASNSRMKSQKYNRLNAVYVTYPYA
jgi:hypothetical protein